ncbi:uncharacterized protein DS421_7g209380 [Arachis hypogaea]|nr:uncharacterized protein DS421_7g209380 [Arachis hypogaea]
MCLLLVPVPFPILPCIEDEVSLLALLPLSQVAPSRGSCHSLHCLLPCHSEPLHSPSCFRFSSFLLANLLVLFF